MGGGVGEGGGGGGGGGEGVGGGASGQAGAGLQGGAAQYVIHHHCLFTLVFTTSSYLCFCMCMEQEKKGLKGQSLSFLICAKAVHSCFKGLIA